MFKRWRSLFRVLCVSEPGDPRSYCVRDGVGVSRRLPTVAAKYDYWLASPQENAAISLSME